MTPAALSPDEPAFTRRPLAFPAGHYLEVKDPCPVYDGRRWHLFGTGVTGPHRFEVLHATADDLAGPWRLETPVRHDVHGSCVAAPGVVADGDRLHLFLQTDYNVPGGRFEHLLSADGGVTFTHQGTALTSLPGTDEAGLYDPHPALVHGVPHLAYSAFSVVGEPDVHLARSTGGRWDGPWERLGPVLRHDQVSCHNPRGSASYEWGLEGPQLLELPDGTVLLTAVCFLPTGAPGTRQRVLLAAGKHPLGPYDVLGPALPPLHGEGSGENGHATLVLDGDSLALVLQERDRTNGRWRYALATALLDAAVGEPAGTAQPPSPDIGAAA